MKEIKTEQRKEVVETIVTYEAVDGTVFHHKEECEKYENSAFGVLMARTKEFTICDKENMNPFDSGCNDNHFKMLKPQRKEDIDTLNQLYFLPSQHSRKDPIITEEHIGKLIMMGWKAIDGNPVRTRFHDMDKVIASLTNGTHKLVENDDTER